MYRKAISLAVVFAAAACGAAVGATPAMAQVAAGASLDQRIGRDTGGPVPAGDPADAILTGRDDVLLLSRRKLFTAQASFEVQYTDNLALSRDERHTGDIGVYDVGLEAATVIDGKVHVHAQAGILGARYSELSGLDYDAGQVAAGASYRRWGFILAGDWAWQRVYHRGFRGEQLAQHRAVVSLSRPIPLAGGRIVVTPSIGADRAWTDPLVYNSYGWNAQLAAAWSTSPRTQLGARLAFARHDYPDYFPGFLGVRRRDELTTAEVSLTHAIGRDIAVQLSAGFAQDNSTSDVNGYRAWSGGGAVSLQKRF